MCYSAAALKNILFIAASKSIWNHQLWEHQVSTITVHLSLRLLR